LHLNKYHKEEKADSNQNQPSVGSDWNRTYYNLFRFMT